MTDTNDKEVKVMKQSKGIKPLVVVGQNGKVLPDWRKRYYRKHGSGAVYFDGDRQYKEGVKD